MKWMRLKIVTGVKSFSKPEQPQPKKSKFLSANSYQPIKAIDAPAYPTLKKPLKRYKPKRGTTISVAATAAISTGNLLNSDEYPNKINRNGTAIPVCLFIWNFPPIAVCIRKSI